MKDIALLILDMQVGNFREPDPIFRSEELLSKIKSLITKMRSVLFPIIYIQNNGGEGDPDEPGTTGWELHPTVVPSESDIILQKSNPDAFQGTSLKRVLDSKQIMKVIITGLQTEFCIDTTCRRAFSLGYKVILVEDAHSTWNSELLTAQQIIDHHNSVLSGWFVTLRKTRHIIEENEFNYSSF